jgi:hypothetical protein
MNEDPPDGVLSPTDLEPDDDHVRPIDDHRIIVETDGGSTVNGGAEDRDDSDAVRSREAGSDDADHAYAVDITVRTPHEVATFQTASNDVRDPFETMLRWYATRIDPDTPPERVLSVLLSTSGLGVDATVTD